MANLESISEQILKDYGSILRQATGRKENRRVPLGAFNIDRLLGGGLPVNRISLIIGPENSYKTTFGLKVVKNYLQRCSICLQIKQICQCPSPTDKSIVYLGLEPLEEEYLARLRLDVSRIWIVNPGYAEKACDCAKQFIQCDDVGLIIVDTLAAFLAEDEGEASYADSIAQGLRARLVTRMFRELIAFTNANPDSPRLAIALNHMLPARPPAIGHVLPGGETQKYLSWVRLRLWKTGRADTKLEFKKTGEEEEKSKKPSNRQQIGFLLEKSKVGRDNIGGELELHIQDDPENHVEWGDVNDFNALFYLGCRYGLIEREGNGIIYNEEKFNSQKGLRAYLLTNPVPLELLKQGILTNQVVF